MAWPGREEALRTQEEALRTRAPGPGGAAGPRADSDQEMHLWIWPVGFSVTLTSGEGAPGEPGRDCQCQNLQVTLSRAIEGAETQEALFWSIVFYHKKVHKTKLAILGSAAFSR